jgi:alpha-amylase
MLMAIHCHQPVGNFGFVFEEAFKRSYKPFLDVLERHPNIKLALHYSGSLIDWLSENQPQFISRIRQMVAKGQVEMLASGYYEPILPMIPETDRRSQIELMKAALKKLTLKDVSGLWLTERVWEPQLPETLEKCGINYTFLDTNHFRFLKGLIPDYAQVNEGGFWDLLGFYSTEFSGHAVNIFPSSKRLRYWIPFQEPYKTVELCRGLSSRGPAVITYADDGEKFGLWPDTFEWVYEKGWLERFFDALDKESDWLATSTPGEYLKCSSGPQAKVYIPCASYEEMEQWSGGYFRNFLTKYPESNMLYKKMHMISGKVYSFSNHAGDLQKKASKSSDAETGLIKQAQTELYKSQCNDVYWHGVFGGLYLGVLRNSAYRHLINAQKILRKIPGAGQDIEFVDVNSDGHEEAVLSSEFLSGVVDIHNNAELIELDYFPKSVNLLNVLGRRYESYHEKLKEKGIAKSSHQHSSPSSIHDGSGTMEEGLDNYLVYDTKRRSSFADHALSQLPSLEEICTSSFGKHCLWSGACWDLDKDKLKTNGNISLDLKRVFGEGKAKDGRIEKSIRLSKKSSKLSFGYRVKNLHVPVIALEFNLSLRDVQRLRPVWTESVSQVELKDSDFGISALISFDKPAHLVTYPIETVSASESGLERTFQGLSVMGLWQTGGELDWGISMDFDIS